MYCGKRNKLLFTEILSVTLNNAEMLNKPTNLLQFCFIQNAVVETFGLTINHVNEYYSRKIGM